MMMTTTVVAKVVNGIREVGIGVILDMDSDVGKSSRVCMLMALEDFYGAHWNNFTTIVRYHFRDSKYDNFQAACVAMDLVKNTQVIALLGPQQSSQANFVLDIAYESKVPIITPATSPDLSSKQNPYLILIAQASSTQVEPIAALTKSFGWTEVVFIFENTDFGRGPIPYLFDAMVNIGTQVKYQALLSPYSTDDSILQQLDKLKAMQTGVFVVHMLPPLASRFFKKANEVGMMAQGYAWIITDVVTGLLHHLNPQDLDSMQGVLGVKPYIPLSNQLTNFEKKWRRRVLKEYPEIDTVELDMFGIWSYDFVFALAAALQQVESESSTPSETRSKGEKHVGFWNPINGLSSRISKNQSLDYTTNKNDLGAIIWPGDALEIPTGWDNKKLRIGVPALGKFVEFFQAYRDPVTNIVYTNGFCMDIFYAVIDAMPYVVDYEIIPYETPDGKRAGTVNDLIYEIVRGVDQEKYMVMKRSPLARSLQVIALTFDMVAGDIAILWNRSNYVDFTLPYLDEGYAMLVPVKVDDRKNAWIFMKPLETSLWIAIGLSFICIGIVVWILERRVNIEFRGHPYQQVGTILWFAFSTLVFAHRENLKNNLSKLVVAVWIFVVLVLVSSYTASLSSMLTIQKLEPTTTNIYELIARGDYVGYHSSSFVEGLLENMDFPEDKLKKYTSFQEYDKALSDGSKNNGVSAIVDGIPYLKMLQAKYCNKYLIVGPVYQTAGFGYEDDCPDINVDVQDFDRLTLASFRGLFFIVGLSSACALVAYVVMFLHENKDILVSNDSTGCQKVIALVRRFIEPIEEEEEEEEEGQ
ncbi:hypothetical protein L1987_07897 [Smallanthus sonchifolius]|uniref:Uncharacterized protein n=1 Tax=Smallanthus sonchifolius TaxID=185202 RepID=A0ACB9JKW7_9ASTR|nr:hypothetical protein L1987_07897 [Smallanthus sonchifolius]